MPFPNRNPEETGAIRAGQEDVMGVLADPAINPSAREHAGIELSGVTKRFLTPAGTAFTALRDVNRVVEPGQFCAVVGPTGCGKSTTLTMVAGLERPSAGVVRVG